MSSDHLGLVQVGEQGNCLDSLSQAHFVCQDSVQVVVVQRDHPLEPSHLVLLQSTADLPTIHQSNTKLRSKCIAGVAERGDGVQITLLSLQHQNAWLSLYYKSCTHQHLWLVRYIF